MTRLSPRRREIHQEFEKEEQPDVDRRTAGWGGLEMVGADSEQKQNSREDSMRLLWILRNRWVGGGGILGGFQLNFHPYQISNINFFPHPHSLGKGSVLYISDPVLDGCVVRGDTKEMDR